MKMHQPNITLLTVKLPRLARWLWLKLPLAAIALLLVVLGVQFSYHPDGSKYIGQLAVASKHHAKTPPRVLGASDVKAAAETPSAAPADVPVVPSGAHANPATSKALIFSQSPTVVYKKPDGANFTIKAGATYSVPFAVSTNDAKAINLPFSPASAGIFQVTTQDPAPYKLAWPMKTESTYVSVGTFNYTLSAKTAAGVTYTGTVQVIVKPMPIFDVYAPEPLVASGSATSDDVMLSGFDQLQFDLSQVADFMPTLTLTVAGYSCHTSLDAADSPTCDAALDSVPAGYYLGSLIFENQFQTVTLPFSVNITP
ncbi:MAG TPA: hypothetical protein VLF40_04635 [Candidatus Saccharimonadales bacterium]|nr:hypothetical protein [Candidatus Saccharimonadales bacterium]